MPREAALKKPKKKKKKKERKKEKKSGLWPGLETLEAFATQYIL